MKNSLMSYTIYYPFSKFYVIFIGFLICVAIAFSMSLLILGSCYEIIR